MNKVTVKEEIILGENGNELTNYLLIRLLKSHRVREHGYNHFHSKTDIELLLI